MDAVPVQQIGGGYMQEHQIDRTYTVSRVQFMLDNYHALLTRTAIPEQDKEIMAGVVTIHSQWWSAQRYWDKVAKKADLDKAINTLRAMDGRMFLILELRYRGENPHDCMKWDEIEPVILCSRTTGWRLHNRAVNYVAWYLGGTSD